jgi:hypothetical protein
MFMNMNEPFEFCNEIKVDDKSDTLKVYWRRDIKLREDEEEASECPVKIKFFLPFSHRFLPPSKVARRNVCARCVQIKLTSNRV